MRLTFMLFILLAISLNMREISAQPNFEHNFISSEIAIVVDEKDLIPEGITYDSKTKRFFLSSKNKDKVIAVYENGNHDDFIKTRQDSMLGSLGLKVDAERRRLWAVSNRRFDDEKVSLVHVFNADNGKLVKRFFAPNDKEYHFNDLILTNEGGAYITDTQSGHLFMVPPDLSELRIFMVDSLITVQNGITISPDNTLLYVEDDTNGIIVIDLIENTIEPINNVMSVFTGGIDGLVYYQNSLIGVANSQYDFEYIARYFLSEDGREIIGATIIDKANPEFITPTTCTMAGDELYVLAATCLMVYNNNQMDQPELLKKPVVLKYSLGK